MKTNPSFIKARGWQACGDPGVDPESCNANCPTGQGKGTLFFNTSFHITIAGDTSGLPPSSPSSDAAEKSIGGTYTIDGYPLSGAWADGGQPAPNMDAGGSLTNVFEHEGMNVGGPTFEHHTMLIETMDSKVGVK